MLTKKSIIIIFSIVVLAGVLFVLNYTQASLCSSASCCPSQTEVYGTRATLVGEVTDDGGDPDLTVWFQYGKTSSYSRETSHQSKHGTGLFCADVYNLDPCTTYHYRAVARNDAGTSYGYDKTFTTTCAEVSVDLKANGSNGPINLNYRQYVNLSWDSDSADTCWASDDWSGTKSVSGSQRIYLDLVGTYTFTITCKNNASGNTESDSVTVRAKPLPPEVITRSATVTY